MVEAQRLKLWAIVDKNGKFSRHDLIEERPHPDTLQFYDKHYRARAPHRAIQVEIKEIPLPEEN